MVMNEPMTGLRLVAGRGQEYGKNNLSRYLLNNSGKGLTPSLTAT
jgi:hypothetical protein